MHGPAFESYILFNLKVARCGRKIALARVKPYTDDVLDGLKHPTSIHGLRHARRQSFYAAIEEL